jgi:hypothetical protein
MIKVFFSFLLAASLFVSHLALAEESAAVPTEESTDPKAPTDHSDAIKSMMPYLQENDSIRKEAAKKYGPAKSKKKSKSKKSKKKKSKQKKAS